MLYIINVMKYDDDRSTFYRLYNIHTDSLIELKQYHLRDIILNSNIKVVNAEVKNHKVVLKQWVNGMHIEDTRSYYTTHQGPKYTLISKKDNTYTLIDFNGAKLILSKRQLLGCVSSNKVANCHMGAEDGREDIITEDVYAEQRNEEFTKEIATKYTNFLAKTAMLGYHNMSFDYSIKYNQVKLDKYTGTCKEVILPSFITIIMTNAFKESSVTSIKLNNGLKVIGAGAFNSKGHSSGIEDIDIPETVELIDEGAFQGNAKLFSKIDGSLNKNRFRVHNDKTIILDQYMH